MIGFYNYTVILTYMSLVSSVLGMFFACGLCGGQPHPEYAMICLMVSGLCDMFDGKVARTKKDRSEAEKKFGIQMIPHAGDMGQIHQHMIIFNNISVGHESRFMEHIPHLREYFKYPINVVDGKFVTPQEPGISADFKD